MLWPAIFGLLGVLIGGLVTFLTQLVILRRQERARRRVGAFLLAHELLVLSSVMTVASDEQLSVVFDPNTDRLFAVWETYRADLAGIPGWSVVATALGNLTVREHLRVGLLDDEGPPALSAERIADIAGDVEAARRALAQVKHPPTRRSKAWRALWPE